MSPEPTPPFSFAFQVESLYAALLQTASPALSSEPGLGGKLLYAGELDEAGLALMAAGNIAGAATLASTADPATQKQAIRTGVVDFLVTSLDEALRVLKNEIRKREPVAVCVAVAPEAVEREMLERGVLPDLLASETSARRGMSATPLRMGRQTLRPWIRRGALMSRMSLSVVSTLSTEPALLYILTELRFTECFTRVPSIRRCRSLTTSPEKRGVIPLSTRRPRKLITCGE